MPKLFTKAFWVQTFEYAVVAAASSFVGSVPVTQANIGAHNWEALGIGAGIAAAYSIAKSIGGLQQAQQIAAK